MKNNVKGNFWIILFYLIFLAMSCLFALVVLGGLPKEQIDFLMGNEYMFIFPMFFYLGSLIYYIIAIHKISGFVVDHSKDRTYIEYKNYGNSWDDGQIYTYNEESSNHNWKVFFLGLLCTCTQPISTVIFGFVLFFRLNIEKSTKIILVCLNIAVVILTIVLIALN